MQLLRDVAQQARFAAMLPGQINQHYREQNADLKAFDDAAFWAHIACSQRDMKHRSGTGFAPGHHEAEARKAERRVREIALQSEIELQRRADLAQADRAMLGILMGAVS